MDPGHPRMGRSLHLGAWSYGIATLLNVVLALPKWMLPLDEMLTDK